MVPKFQIHIKNIKSFKQKLILWANHFDPFVFLDSCEEELYGIYSFKQVHQMISTVVSEVETNVSIIDIIKYAFPMGSMTGAPKIRAMELIEKYEKSKRGLYSGSVGYITPNKNFDFNVVIRSILYNQLKNYVSFTVGGAITSLSVPENEYEECMVKAQAIFNVLNKNADD